MDRRKALRGMGLSLGYMIATPLVMDLLQSCTKTPGILWTPNFFTKDEGIIIQKLVDLILPATNESPGAIDVDVPQFLDNYLNEVVTINEQEYFKKGLGMIHNYLGNDVEMIKIEKYDSLLATFLKASPEEKEKFKSDAKKKLIYETLIKLRNSSVWAYKTSKNIGRDILAYDPVPVLQKGCVSLQETTGGKAWSFR